ncbi:nitroreductase, partial [Candidatus Poribacteria bacterium]|nr:nitroreductase [Candidatus Poribacteria bacterium]
VVLVFLAHPLRSAPKYGSRGADLYSVQDATIACAYAQLAATDLGLSSCWIGAFAPEPVAEAVNAPKHLTPVAMLPLGYAAEEPGPTTRRGVRDIVTWETF